MPDFSYWKALVSNVLREFQQDRNVEVVQLIRLASLKVEHNAYDS